MPGPRPAPDTVVTHVPRGTPVQRSVHVPVPVGQPGGRASAVTAGPVPGGPEPAVAFADPGAVAVDRGLAHRDPDGSVVFDLAPGPAPSPPLPPETVQRQDASGPADAPGPSPATAPPAATAPSGAATVTTAAAGHARHPASPPLDELARQLFGPLSARLKAELRLDRERAGLLTDLRQ